MSMVFYLINLVILEWSITGFLSDSNGGWTIGRFFLFCTNSAVAPLADSGAESKE